MHASALTAVLEATAARETPTRGTRNTASSPWRPGCQTGRWPRRHVRTAATGGGGLWWVQIASDNPRNEWVVGSISTSGSEQAPGHRPGAFCSSRSSSPWPCAWMWWPWGHAEPGLAREVTQVSTYSRHPTVVDIWYRCRSTGCRPERRSGHTVETALRPRCCG